VLHVGGKWRYAVVYVDRRWSTSTRVDFNLGESGGADPN